MLTTNLKVASWVSLPSSIETKIQKPQSDGYKTLRNWQIECFDNLKDESHSIINTPTGCGKSIAISSIVWEKLKNNPKLKSIIVVPQAFVSKGFLGKKNPDGSRIPNFVLLPDGELMEWSPFHDLAVGYDESSINGLIDWLSDRNKNKNINSKILVCCSQTFVLAFEKISKMNSTERNKLIRDLLVVIDEAHHVKIMEETEENIAIHNALGTQVKNLYHSSNRGNQIILVTATFFRGDRCQLLSQEMKPSFVRFDLPWDKWLPQMQHLKSFTYDYVFDRTIDNYDESMDKSITHLFQQNLKKLVVYIPQRNSFFAQKGKEGKNNEVDRIIKIIAEKLDAVVEGKTKDGIIQLKLADGTHYRILDLVGEELRDAKKKFFSGYSGEDINANRDAIDCIIALNMFGEGADWEHANGMIIVGQKDSLTDLVQRVGRVLRDSEGKPTAKVMHILPFNLNEDPDDSLGDSLNNRFKALALAMLMMDVMNPELVLPKRTREKSNEKTDKVKNQSILSQLPLDENELKSFNEDVTREMLTLAGNQKERDGNYSCSLIKEQMPRIVRESIEDVLTEKDIFLTDEKYVQLGNEMYHKVCRHAVAQEYGINVAEIEWNMIENADPISFLLRFISQSVDGDALIRLREIIANSADLAKDKLIAMAKRGEDRPNYRKHPLGVKLCSYTNKNSESYDAEFDTQIRELRPDWFEDTVKINKDELIAMARRGEDRPNYLKHPLGVKFRSYTSKNSESYDAEFDVEIRELRPDWFEDTARIAKDELTAMARRGEDRPNSKSSLGLRLCRYTNKNNGCYDAEFDTQIRELRPDWFENTARINKDELIAMAKRGEDRPNKRKHPLGGALISYISKNSKCYDAEFDAQIRELAPKWFEDTARINKDELIAMAKRGEDRPNQKKHPLGKVLSSYIDKNGSSYDAEFDTQIRELRPDWFRG
jgi:superfamily II DNA or RNA helicase